MNKGVEILLARMDSHPEEFGLDKLGRWTVIIDRLVNNELPFLSGQELEALKEKLYAIQGDVFTRAIMDELVNGDGQSEMFSGRFTFNRDGVFKKRKK